MQQKIFMMRKNAIKNICDEEKCNKKIIVMMKNTSKNNYDEEKCYKKWGWGKMLQKIRMTKNATKSSINQSEGIEMPDIYLMKGEWCETDINLMKSGFEANICLIKGWMTLGGYLPNDGRI